MGTVENGTDRCRRVLILILIAFWALALVYTVSVPLGEAPDEVPHFNFVRFLAEKRVLPAEAEAGSEGFQPPLYYALGALATAWLEVGDFEIRANTDFSWDRPETSRNLLLHTKAESFPYSDGALAWHIVRALSIVMGSITIITTYLIGREIFPTQPALALSMAAVNAFTPEFIFMSSVVNNDNLIAMLSAIVMLKLIKVLKGATAWRDFIQLGSLLGLGLITKSSAIVFAPLAVIVIFSTQAGKGFSWLQRMAWSAVTAVFAFGFSGWWFLRNQLLHGDPLGWGLKVSISDLRQSPLGWQDFPWLVDGLFQSFWGRFGGAAHIRLGLPIYAVLSVIVLASLAGCAVAVLRAIKTRRLFETRSFPLVVLPALCVGLTFSALVRWTMTFLGTDQARLLYPALPSLILFLLLGLMQIVPPRLHKLSLGALCLALLTLAAITPFAIIGPVYSPPQRLIAAEAPLVPNPATYDFDGIARLVGYEFDKGLYKPGETARLTLYWQAIGQIREDQWLQIQLVDGSGRVVFQKEGCPSGGGYSADLWQIGEIVQGIHFLRLSPSIPYDSYAMRLSLRPTASKAWLPVFDRRTGRVDDSISIARLRLGDSSPSAAIAMEKPARALLGGKLALLGYSLRDVDSLRPGGRFVLALYWQKLPGAPIDTKLTVFTQLLDAANAIQAQMDGQPVRGAYPTTVWEDGETVVDIYELTVSQGAKAGPHILISGLYDAVTGERFMVTDESGKALGDHVRLAELRVQ